jgi:putative Mn2+ efflux pump MntP
MQNAKRDLGEIVCGAVMLVLGVCFLSGARSALLYHTTIYFKGWMYPWQAIIGGSLVAGLGLFLIIHGICRKKKRSGDS